MGETTHTREMQELANRLARRERRAFLWTIVAMAIPIVVAGVVLRAAISRRLEASAELAQKQSDLKQVRRDFAKVNDNNAQLAQQVSALKARNRQLAQQVSALKAAAPRTCVAVVHKSSPKCTRLKQQVRTLKAELARISFLERALIRLKKKTSLPIWSRGPLDRGPDTKRAGPVKPPATRVPLR